MKLKSIALTNFRAFQQASIPFGDAVTVILANNGAGKTSIIEACALALRTYARQSVNPGKTIKEISTGVDQRLFRRTWSPDESYPERVEQTLVVAARFEQQSSMVTSTLHAFLKFEPSGYQTDARVELSYDESAPLAGVPRESETATLLIVFPTNSPENSSLPDPIRLPLAKLDRRARWASNVVVGGSWAEIREVWKHCLAEAALNQGASQQVNRIAEAISLALSKVLELTGAPRWSADADDFVIDLPGVGLRPVGYMSDGWRSTVALAATIAYRYAYINPHLDPLAACGAPGVLVVDEIERHLHPGLQQLLLSRLRIAFPELQIIVSTHSPLIASGSLFRDDVTMLGIDIDEGELSIGHLSKPTGMDAAQVLTGPWFRLPTTLDPGTVQLYDNYQKKLSEDPRGAVPLAAQLRERLEGFEGSVTEHIVQLTMASLDRDREFSKLTYSELLKLRDDTVKAILAKLKG